MLIKRVVSFVLLVLSALLLTNHVWVAFAKQPLFAFLSSPPIDQMYGLSSVGADMLFTWACTIMFHLCSLILVPVLLPRHSGNAAVRWLWVPASDLGVILIGVWAGAYLFLYGMAAFFLVDIANDRYVIMALAITSIACWVLSNIWYLPDIFTLKSEE